MIGTELMYGQGLGNQLFCYISTRCLALEHGYDYSILGSETVCHNLHNDCGLYFMDLDYGKPAVREDFAREYHEKEDRVFMGTAKHDLVHGCYITGADEKVLQVEDGTLLYGNLQDEAYFGKYRQEILKWFAVKPEYEDYRFCDDNICVLNVRGREYLGTPALFVNRRYWKNAMKYMKSINPNMRFVVVTDDVEAANRVLPELPAYHGELHEDYTRVKNARYLVLSNTSFAFFPAYTSQTAKVIIAPKYWARHNVSDGFWASEQNIYSIFTYMDRKGRLFSAQECRQELEAYKQTSRLYRKINVRPQGAALRLQQLRCRYIIAKDYFFRIFPAVSKRVKRMINRGRR